MQPPSYYRNREQTYLKHFFLERYLQRVAYNIGSYSPHFVFVDGFSGPWRSDGESFADTSFTIAIQELRKVKAGLATIGRNPNIRCVFVEKSRAAYNSLAQAVAEVNDIPITTFNGEFEEKITDILHHVGPAPAFALFFIDPTGWRGYGMRAIAPLLRHRGEVLINFMFDHINRFINEHPNEEVQAGFDDLFGTKDWRSHIEQAEGRERAIVDYYCSCLKANSNGNYTYVTYTRIDYPTSERTYFYLIYGTGHVKGIREFRKVEKEFAHEQLRVRSMAQQEKRVNRTGQQELFGPNLEDMSPLEEERESQLEIARLRFLRLLDRMPLNAKVSCSEIFGHLLEVSLFWESDLQTLLKEYRNKGVIEFDGMGARERTVKVEHELRRLK